VKENVVDKVIDWLALELPKYWKVAIALVPLVAAVGTEVVQAISEGTVDGKLTALLATDDELW
jgi:hypothetical protein